MKIAVIGASGFIGQNLVEYFFNTELKIIPVYFTHEVKYPNAIKYDDFINKCKEVDVVVFTAGNSNHYVTDEILYEIIQKDTFYIQEVLHRVKASKAIMMSSAAVYYGYEGQVDEEVCPRPTVNYGISKRIAEMLFEKEVKNGKIKAVVLRLTHAFGEGERKTRLFRNIARAVINKEPLKLHGTGESYINPIPIEFVCRAVKHFVENDVPSEVEYYNIGSMEPVKVREIVEGLMKIFDFQYIFEGEESQPVSFVTKVDKLARIGLIHSDMFGSVSEYVRKLIEES